VHQESLDQLPDVLTISEVARFLRVSTAVVYGMAGRYRRTNGREGMPVFRAGARMMRIAKLDLIRYMTGKTLHGPAQPG
jgi:hypothetical protein